MPTPAELRQQSRALREAADGETNSESKRKLAIRALALAELAEQIERTGAFIARENIERYERMLATGDLDEKLRIIVETLLAEQQEAAQVQGGVRVQPEQAPRWRMKAAELRAVADQTQDAQARLSLRRLAETYDRMAQSKEDRAARKARIRPEAG